MPPRKKSETISFRADQDLLRQIDEARRRFGTSRGDWTRAVIGAHLYRHDEEQITLMLLEISAALTRIEGEIPRLLVNQARSLFAVLTLIVEMPPEEAKKLIRSKLHGPSAPPSGDQG